jgi:pyrimidine operon attenuation protein/uracil phosphoribosyltransferase
MIRNRSKRLQESRLLGRESQGAFIANLLNRWIARGSQSS